MHYEVLCIIRSDFKCEGLFCSREEPCIMRILTVSTHNPLSHSFLVHTNDKFAQPLFAKLCSDMPHVPGLDGLDEDLTFVSSGGDSIEWMNFDERRFYTNAFILSRGKVSPSSTTDHDQLGFTRPSNRFYLGTRKEGLVYTSTIHRHSDRRSSDGMQI